MRRFLYFSVFVCGLASMAIEMTASRMIGNVFSSANLVWAFIIGSILLYLALGNWLGGQLADRFQNGKAYATIVMIAGIFCCLIPVFSRPLLLWGASAMDQINFGMIGILFVIILIILLIPMTALGMISPFAIRLANEFPGHSQNKTNGKILAVSTIGSFIGTMLPTFLLIPWIGSNRSFFLIGLLLILTAIVGFTGFEKNNRWKFTLIIVLLPVILLWQFPRQIKESENQLYETESAYNYIEIVQESGFNLLKLNDGQGIQSIYHPDIDNYYGPWEQILTAPFFTACPLNPEKIQNAAILGSAGGTSASQMLKVFPNVQIDGFEIDPEITRLAKRYFAMPETNYNVSAMDGRIGLMNSKFTYDVVMVDAYQTPYIAVNMCTVEFFRIVKGKLTSEGVLVMNIGREENDRSLLNSITKTARQVFPNIFIVDIPNAYNSILFAMTEEGSTENLQCNYDILRADQHAPDLLIETLSVALGNPAVADYDQGIIFTDDYAPVEMLTNRTIFNALFQ